MGKKEKNPKIIDELKCEPWRVWKSSKNNRLCGKVLACQKFIFQFFSVCKKIKIKNHKIKGTICATDLHIMPKYYAKFKSIHQLMGLCVELFLIFSLLNTKESWLIGTALRTKCSTLELTWLDILLDLRTCLRRLLLKIFATSDAVIVPPPPCALTSEGRWGLLITSLTSLSRRGIVIWVRFELPFPCDWFISTRTAA